MTNRPYYRQEVEPRFWPRVDRSGGAAACWPWLGHRHPNGYGKLMVAGSTVYAHRIAYELAHGQIPPGLQIDHVRDRGCTRKDCCNPAHLEAVTPRTNLLRGDGACAINARKTHCKRGHEFTPENTRTRKDGHRECLACRQKRGRVMETNHLLDLPPETYEPVIDTAQVNEWLASPRPDEEPWWASLGDLLDGEPEDESPFHQALRCTYTSTR